MMPLTAFNNFTSNLEQTIRLIGEDIIRKMESCTKKDKTRHRKFYNPEIQLLSMTPGSFNVQLGPSMAQILFSMEVIKHGK